MTSATGDAAQGGWATYFCQAHVLTKWFKFNSPSGRISKGLRPLGIPVFPEGMAPGYPLPRPIGRGTFSLFILTFFASKAITCWLIQFSPQPLLPSSRLPLTWLPRRGSQVNRCRTDWPGTHHCTFETNNSPWIVRQIFPPMRPFFGHFAVNLSNRREM